MRNKDEEKSQEKDNDAAWQNGDSKIKNDERGRFDDGRSDEFDERRQLTWRRKS